MGKSKTAKHRDAPPPSNKQPDTSGWTRLADQLEGPLSIRIDEPFVDLEHLCPRSAWLVIHLDLIRPVTSIPLALDALAVLCVRSERLRLDDKLHEAYWRQMLTSDIMRDAPSANAPDLSKFIRFVKHKNVRVMLSWEGRRFQSAVTPYLRSFLEASTAKYDAIADSLDGGIKWRVWRSLHVGIRFADSSLTRGDIHTIKAMLTSTQDECTEESSNASYLCEQHTLRKLDLRGNRMGARELRELASLLEDPLCRRIDDLDLEKTFPDDVASSTDNNYAIAFKRVITAALTAKPATKTSSYVRADAGFAISLAHNTMYDEDALLDLTLADVDLDNDKFHDELVDVVVPRLREALDRGVAVCCAVRKRETETYPSKEREYRYRLFLEKGVLYPVVEVLPDGWCRVAPVVEDESDDDDDEDEEEEEEVDDEDEEGAYWIPFSSIAGLYVEDEDVPDIMRMRFSALICDGDNDQFRPIDSPTGAHVEDFVVSVGREIQRLSIRCWRDRDWTLAYLLSQCPNLCQLDVEGSTLGSFTLDPSHWATLEAINMSGAKMGSNFWTCLSSRLEEYGEVQATASHRNSVDEREEQREEVALVKLRIDSAVLSRCVEYAGNITTRRIVWSDPLPVRKWFRPHQPPP